MKIKNLFASLLGVVLIIICMFISCSKKSNKNNSEKENIENPTQEDKTEEDTKEENIEDAWIVEEYKDGYSIVGYKKSDVNVIFPAIINNKKVYQILAKREGGAGIIIPIFPDRSKIVSLDLSKSIYLETIGDNAFREYSSLESVVLPNNLTYIGASAFYSCISLESIVIPDKVTYMGDFIFYKCTSLRNIVLPDNLTTLEEGAFSNCISLESIVIPDKLTHIVKTFEDCTSLKSVVLSKNLNFTNNPGFNIFSGCISLESIDIPYGNTSIQGTMFAYCTALKNVTIASTVTRIDGQLAFFSCHSLTRITIPNSVNFIGDNTFLDSGISEIHLPSMFNTPSEMARIGIPSTATVIPN